MSQPQDDTRQRVGDRVPRRFWVGVLALVIYILFAAVLGNITGSFAPEGDVMAEFALSHLIPLPIAIGLALWFTWWSGWWRDVWSNTSTLRMQPRRLWLIAIPVLLVARCRSCSCPVSHGWSVGSARS